MSVIFFVNILLFCLVTTIYTHKCHSSASKPPKHGPREPCSDIPVVVLAYNNPTLVRLLVDQLRRCFNATVVIMDNGSDFPGMITYLREVALDQQVVVWRLPKNYGPHIIFKSPRILKRLPRFFALSDSDVRLGDSTPVNFLCVLAHATDEFGVPKAGLALDISDREEMFDMLYYKGKTIYQWEKKFYAKRLYTPDWPELSSVYSADVDTTLAVYDQEKLSGFTFTAVRVGGIFTAKHRPWYSSVYRAIPDDEIAAMFAKSSGTMAQIYKKKGLAELRKKPKIRHPDSKHARDLMSFTCAGRKHSLYIPRQP